MTSSEALDSYLARSRGGQLGCADQAFVIKIDASLPKLRKQGRMSGLKVISQTGQIAYRGLRFTGDSLVKSAVIARFLAADMAPPERSDIGVTRENYSFTFEKTADYNGYGAFVFCLKPKRRRVGLFKGELWLDANTGAPLRLWGDFVKSPSIFIRSLRFVQDYQQIDQCSNIRRLLLSVQTRIAGQAEMAVWLDSPPSEHPPVWGSPVEDRSSGQYTSDLPHPYLNVERHQRIDGPQRHSGKCAAPSSRSNR